jgi:hypothetical protein
MRKVALYIEDQRVDLFDDEVISLTQTIQNVKDISKIFTPFSKSFTLPASKTNNKIFSHYYNADIVNGFDARKKVEARIEINQLPFQDGKIKLNGVKLKNNVAYAYNVTFFGNTVDLKDVLGEDKLGGLSWLSNFTRNYTALQVRTDLQTDGVNITVGGTTYTDAICVPLISARTELFYDSSVTPPDYFNADGTINPLGANLYAVGGNDNGVYFEELKYAIRLWLIVKAIEEQYPEITFSAGSFIKDTSNPQFYDLYMWMHRQKGFAFKQAEVTNQYLNFIADTLSMTRVFMTPSTLVVFNMFSGQTVGHSLSVVTAPASEYTVAIYRNGILYQSQTFAGGTTGTILSGFLNNGNYTVFVTGTSTQTINLTWTINDSFLGETNAFTSVSAHTLTSNPLWNSQQQIPDIKVIDFLTGIFKMFNLTAYKNKAGEIVVQKLDDFYASGTTRDISKYVDINESEVNVALPYKELKFEYKGRGTKLAQLYEQEQESGWGTENFVVDNEFSGEVYNVEVPFEHMQFSRASGTDVQFGSCVDDNGAAYIGEPILFYRILKTSGTNIRFVDSAASVVIINAYCMPSNSVSLSAPTNDDTNHFSVEINEYTPTDTFDGSLYANYYESYIADVFNSKRRLTKVKAYLSVSFLIDYSLADTIFINNRYYNINAITTNLQTGESELELLNVV